MAIRLNVGVSRKIGLPDYGSAGASCNVEVELDGSLLQSDLDAFHRHVRNAFIACEQAVGDQLSRLQGADCQVQPRNAVTNGQSSQNGVRSNGSAHPGDDHANGNGSHRASQKQLDYANQLAKQIRGLGVRKLEGLASKMFNKQLVDLTTMDASGLIDALKAIKEDRISLDDALLGVAA